MKITITIPDNLTTRLEQKLGDLSQQVLIIFALNSYQNKLISTHELGQILGLESVYEVHSFLKESGVHLNYDEEELLEDIQIISRHSSLFGSDRDKIQIAEDFEESLEDFAKYK